MDEEFRSIGSGNRDNPDQRVSADRAHGDLPDHVDMVVRIPEVGAHKIRVDRDGEILTDELV